MSFKKFNQLTSDEFLLLQGTEKMANMISNKWIGSGDVLDILQEHSIGQYCAVKYGKEYILYFESPHDIMIVQEMLKPEQQPSPTVQSINISYE